MNIDFDAMDPGEIDELMAAKRSEAEDRRLASLGLDTLAIEHAQLADQVKSLTKRQKKTSEELAAVRSRLRDLKTKEDAQIREALLSRVSPHRLMELTGKDRAALSRIGNSAPGGPSAAASASTEPTSPQ